MDRWIDCRTRVENVPLSRRFVLSGPGSRISQNMMNTPSRNSAKAGGTVHEDRVAKLVERAQRGEQAALDQLVSEHLPLVYNIVGRALAGHPDTDDVVQETLLRVVDGLGGLREPASFRSWTVAIAMNQIRRRHRSAQPLAGLEDSYPLSDPGADFADLTIVRLGLSEQRREVVEATRWLDQDDRELLALWWLEAAGELSRTDLAAALELSPEHASVRVQRMKGQLETARVVVRALAGRPLCPTLAMLTSDWNGVPSALWRKRVARHARECATCSQQWENLVPAEGLLAGLALVPLPSGYGPTGPFSPVRSASPHGPIPRRSGAGGHHRARPRWRIPHTVLAAGVAAAATVGVVAYALPPAHRSVAAGLSSSQAQAIAASGSASSPAVAPTSAAASPSATPSSAKPTPAPRRSTPKAAASTTAARSTPTATASHSSSSGSNVSSAVQQVLALINSARAGQGLAALTLTSGLDASAAKHDSTMADGCGLSHQCPGEAALGQRETDQGVDWTSAGENIGEGGPVSATSSAEASMAVGLTQSMLDEKPPNDGHRANILSTSFTHIGIAVIRDSSGTVWLTQDFSN